ncbi:hypothetical protein SAMN05421821_11082 [Mucilaginibacter lappiensis]|uniref:Outer membrane protein beta-barrel domain-containing protein n=1 Tax=Mucilaginibacter lappiensis TaxID=354630 RepID=A0ABR6PMS4_9SPHI|nr:hypothetical protein [Mucilaginibacter lappiensis]MBB6111063.1 hypothetical protein [Mucilaginibacter lappiensis]SIR68373.1 hypothetical protein SAMN05421821_11082 [Mucilaginibacter lappiensis]
MEKKFKLILWVAIINLTTYSNLIAQTQVIGKWYITTSELSVKSLPTGKDTAISYRVRPGTKFTITDIKNNIYTVLFGYYYGDTIKNKKNRNAGATKAGNPLLLKDVNFSKIKKSDLTTYPQDNAFIGNWANFKQFTILAEDLNRALLYNTGNFDFTFGALTLPLKIRFGNGGNTYSAFEENLNLGLTFGLKYTVPGTKEQSINMLGLIGVTSANLDSVAFKNPKFYSSKITSTRAISAGVGLMYQYSAFQVGLFGGIDHISGELGRQWRHQDRFWMGFAIGVSLYSKDSINKNPDEKITNKD